MSEKLFKAEWEKMHSGQAYLKAVVRAFQAVENPGAEIWSTNRPYFVRHALPLVVAGWAEETGLDPDQFPYTEDSVVYTWLSWRKAMDGVKTKTLERLGLDDLFSVPS